MCLMARNTTPGHDACQMFMRQCPELFPLADGAGDAPAADLLAQRLTVHGQTAWMLRALLEAQRFTCRR